MDHEYRRTLHEVKHGAKHRSLKCPRHELEEWEHQAAARDVDMKHLVGVKTWSARPKSGTQVWPKHCSNKSCLPEGATVPQLWFSTGRQPGKQRELLELHEEHAALRKKLKEKRI